MLLYLIRHGIAVERGTPGMTDAQRPLTPRGLRRMRRNARGLHRLGIRIDSIWTSPLLRARQTADVLAAAFALAHSIRGEPALAPPVDVDALLVRLRGEPIRRRIALVGHEPHLGQLAVFLMTGLNREAIAFRKGGAACIEVESFRRPIRGHLQWLLTPRQMRSMCP